MVTATRIYQATCDATFSAAQRAVERMGMNVEDGHSANRLTATRVIGPRDDLSDQLRFRVSVIEAELGATAVKASSTRVFQLFWRGEHRRVASQLLDEIGRQLASDRGDR
jgi:hypothetical protein